MRQRGQEGEEVSGLLASFFAKDDDCVCEVYGIRVEKRICAIILCFIGPERTVMFIYSDICAEIRFHYSVIPMQSSIYIKPFSLK